MSFVVNRISELALINLCFAEADLAAYGDEDNRLIRVRRHIQGASALLRVIAPDFDGYIDLPADASEEAA